MNGINDVAARITDRDEERFILPASTYFNYGLPHGANGYGIRDNAGVLEVKNLTGTWSEVNLLSRASGVLSPAHEGDSFNVCKGSNGELITFGQSKQLISATASTTVNSTIDIPASAIVLGVSAYVTVTMSNTATSLQLFGATSGLTLSDTFGVAPASTVKGMTASPYLNATAEKVQVVADSTMSTIGRIRVVVNYIAITAPTS